jgi:hypothetical protein
MKNKQLLTALKTVTDFAAAQDLEPENLRCLVEYMVTHKLSITAASLHLAHKQLYENSRLSKLGFRFVEEKRPSIW